MDKHLEDIILDIVALTEEYERAKTKRKKDKLLSALEAKTEELKLLVKQLQLPN